MQALVTDIAGAAGLLLLTVALCQVDLRLGLGTLGLILFSAAVYGIIRQPPAPPREPPK